MLTLVLAACSNSSAPPRAVVPTPVDPATAASITIDVTYSGSVPPPKALNMASAAQCAAAHSEPVYDPSLAVHDGHLANAVVWIKDGLQNWVFAPPAAPAIIDQK